jgi:branched-chain amino acid transport system substrate-binding protein
MRLLCGSLFVVMWWVSASACAQTSLAADKAIRIHHIGPFTGLQAGINREALGGAKLYLDRVNRAGGVRGRRIEIIESDDKQDAKLAGELASSLISRGEVLTFFMPRTSPSNQAILKAVEGTGVPIVAPQVGPDFLYAEDQKLAFTVRASYGAELIRAINLQLRFDRKSFAFLAADDAFGNPLVQTAIKQLSEVKIAPQIEKVDNRKAEVQPGVTRFLQSKPEVIFLLCNVACASDFVNRFREAGGSTQFVALSNNGSGAFVKALGNNAKGVIVMQVMPLPQSRTIKISREYADASAAAKAEASYLGLQGYISARVLVEGLRRAGGTLNSASLIRGLESMRSFDLGDFVISYGANDRSGSEFVDETIISSRGQFVR